MYSFSTNCNCWERAIVFYLYDSARAECSKSSYFALTIMKTLLASLMRFCWKMNKFYKWENSYFLWSFCCSANHSGSIFPYEICLSLLTSSLRIFNFWNIIFFRISNSTIMHFCLFVIIFVDFWNIMSASSWIFLFFATYFMKSVIISFSTKDSVALSFFVSFLHSFFGYFFTIPKTPPLIKSDFK